MNGFNCWVSYQRVQSEAALFNKAGLEPFCPLWKCPRGCSITGNVSNSSETNPWAEEWAQLKLCCHSSAPSAVQVPRANTGESPAEPEVVTAVTQRSLCSWGLLSENASSVLEYLLWECYNTYFCICDPSVYFCVCDLNLSPYSIPVYLWVLFFFKVT